MGLWDRLPPPPLSPHSFSAAGVQLAMGNPGWQCCKPHHTKQLGLACRCRRRRLVPPCPCGRRRLLRRQQRLQQVVLRLLHGQQLPPELCLPPQQLGILPPQPVHLHLHREERGGGRLAWQMRVPYNRPASSAAVSSRHWTGGCGEGESNKVT